MTAAAASPARRRLDGATVLRRLVLVAMPLALAVVLWWHPPGGADVYADVRDDVGAWLFVHTTLLLAMPLLGIATFLLLRGLESRAATISRAAIVCFLVFYTAYEVTVGLGTGVLVEYADGLPAADQDAVADAIQHLNRNVVLGDPVSVALVLGFVGWVVAMLAAATALRRAGAGLPTTLLVAGASLFAVHPPPVGPVGLVCLAAAAVAIERAGAREHRGDVPGA
ncbi:MAG TPA: hypothetical protein VLB86_02545 [Gaiellaceae bacterium]|nr:hypothetical protein [Gaiellaceae bacterium]